MTQQATQKTMVPEQHTAPESIIRFYRLIEDCPEPQRADRSAGGLIPTRAFRYCEPMTAASAFGWYLFPPQDFRVLFTGSDILWQLGSDDDWYPLEAIQYPDFADSFNASCPSHAKGYAPPFLSAPPEPGVVKIWSGMIARTQPDWSLLVRRPVNLPGNGNCEYFEGIIETDNWFGPLFTNIRITKTDTPILFKREMPFMQVQPLQRSTYSEAVLRNFDFTETLEDFQDEDWSAYHQTIIEPGDPFERERGSYAKLVRKARLKK